jgi:hypothetical protein
MQTDYKDTIFFKLLIFSQILAKYYFVIPEQNYKRFITFEKK